jgi:hypothetical protein
MGPSQRKVAELNLNQSVCLIFSQVFSAYVYLLTDGSTSKVGYLTGLSGLAQVSGITQQRVASP